MSLLAKNIFEAISDDRYVFSDHADLRLRERRIKAWQVVAGLDEAKLLREAPNATPNPCIELEQTLPDGTDIKVVWAWNAAECAAKLVTVHFFDR